MNFIIKNIPNSITCINVFAGGLACVFALIGTPEQAMTFIVIGAVADFFDGLAARLLKAYSNIGKDLDSLADNITFGLAPSLILFSFMNTMVEDNIGFPVSPYLPYFAFLISIFSTIRLAKFNNDSRQSESFIGLPVPANALFWSSLIVGMQYEFLSTNKYLYLLFALIFIFSFLLVSEIPMFSLKFKSLALSKNKLRYIFLLISVAVLLALGMNGVWIVILIYVLLSATTSALCKK